MYSRIPRQPPRPAGVPSYRQRVTPPPNYSGNAFPAEPDPDDARPRFDGLPTVSTLPARDMPPASEEPVSASAQESDADCSASASADNIPAPSPDAPRFALPDLSHFPFGHGLGQEELLLLKVYNGTFRIITHNRRKGNKSSFRVEKIFHFVKHYSNVVRYFNR